MITGRDIKDGSITSADIKNRTIETRQLSTEAVATLKTRWNSGVGAPTEEGSVTGDWYVDTTTGNAYKNTPSGWELRVNIMGATGAPGAVGPQGATGNTGAKGDTGVDGTKGDTGVDGTKWLQGTTSPAPGTGAMGDWYLNTTTYDAYEKTAGGWAAVVNLRGPVGPKGDTGAPGAAGATGATGAVGAQGANGQQGTTGATGPQGPIGPLGPVGPIGPIGPQGIKGDTGAIGPQGTTGATGPAGPAGASGGGAVLKDRNGVTLGKIISAGSPGAGNGVAQYSRGVLIETSTGYILNVGWDGQAAKGQLYYAGNCSGDAYWNAGNSTPQTMYGKSAVYSHSLNQWMVIETVANGFATSAAMPAIGGFDNSGASGWNCGVPTNQPTQSAWKMRSATTDELGLPATTGNQFALPLSLG
ncbi:collagen-like protein [Nocardioides alpinus]|nr:collagen-like protein [Nocardioides alpinus]